ncbi:prephenate dehydratase [Paenibacillus sp. KN14-4R]|uniref:prephenate dehydratase n=1 Tax=Paenibacillus sp. KN14-4R TaxID=3445773 RepID=UPI003F9F41F9
MRRIALLGPGTFSEESVQHFLGSGHYEYVNSRFISDVFTQTASGQTDYGVIPIENTIDGSVALHMDWLVHEVDLPIQAEWVYPVDINLIGFTPKGQIDSENPYRHIRKVLSHPVALAQCRQFIKQHMPDVEIEQVSTTAEGVRQVQAAKDPATAAFGTTNASKLYDVPVLAALIQDHKDNVTRFLLVGEEKPQLQKSEHMKTTILVTMPEDYPGGLHQVLSAFAWRRINLSRIESRPTKKKLGNYYFYIEIEGSLDSILLRSSFEEIEAIGCEVRILGCYPCYTHKSGPIMMEV